MKKAIIITAIIFIISSIATLCFAVALGSEAIADFVKDNGASLKEHLHSGEEFFNYITDSETDIGGVIQDGVEKFIDGAEVFSNTDFSIIGNSEYNVAGEKASDISVEDKEELRIFADVASVVIKTTEDATMSVSNDIYSKSSPANTDDYTLLIDDEGYDVYLKAKKNNRNTVSELTVEIPQDYDGKIIVECSVGNITIDGALLEAAGIDATVNVGNITAKNSTVNNASLSADTGNITVTSDFTCLNSELRIKTDIGSVEYSMPAGRNVDVIYNINTGSAETAELNGADGITVTKNSQAGTNGTESSGSVKGGNATNTDNVLNVSIEVSIGNIEFKLNK